METWNDPKTVINQNVPVDTQNKLLIEKLLDTLATIESPMANLLIHEGNAELLMSYLTRNTNTNDNQLSIVRPNEVNVDLKRAYQVVQLFTQNSKAFAIFVSVRINNIVSSLFNIFRKDSVGSFHHWKAVFEILLENHPTKVASLLSENNTFLQYFYDYIHEETVSEALFVLLTSNKLVINDRKKLYSKFNEIKFIQRVVSEKLFNPQGDHAVITNFLLSFFRRMMVIQTSSAIFNHISKSTYFMMTELMSTFTNKNYTEEQKKWIAHLIKNLFLLCKQETLETSATHTPPQKINNYLTPFFDTFVTQAKNALTGLLDSLVLTNHLGKEDEQKDTFTEYRLYLLQVLSFLVSDEDLSILSKFSLPLWKSLVKWFFLHANNNIYHSLFYKFWRACLEFNNEPIFRILFSKCKFVNRLLTHYETNPTSPLNGFVLLICNTIRFSSSLQITNKFFSDYISSNQQFSKFVPTIIEQTSKQAIPYKCDTIKLPYPHFQPYQKETVVQNMFNEKIEGNLEIELGSLYAHIVGFNQPPKEKPLVITPRNDEDTNSLVKEIEGMSISNNNTNNLLKELSNVSSPKKKNKKKNKKKGGNKGNNNVNASPVKGNKNGEKN